jgi:DedD protein
VDKTTVEKPQPEEKPLSVTATEKVTSPSENAVAPAKNIEKPVPATATATAVKKAELVTKVAAEEKTPAPKSASYAALDAKGVPEAWVIQLASLKSKENAQKLQKELLGYGFPAYVKSVNKADGVSFRVLVGPKLNRQKAEEMAKAIEKKQGSKGMIVKFQAGYEQ